MNAIKSSPSSPPIKMTNKVFVWLITVFFVFQTICLDLKQTSLLELKPSTTTVTIMVLICLCTSHAVAFTTTRSHVFL